jgi:2,3-bisphosphoglycerate-dependent phosphoglycerate mutase
MQLYLIRHGQSTNNALWDASHSEVGRVVDPPLTPLGRQQAIAAGVYLAASNGNSERDPQNRNGFGLTHLYCSLMDRAINTGLEISRAVGLPLVAWTEAHEGGGLYAVDEVSGAVVGVPGGNREYFATRYPELTLPVELGNSGWYRGGHESADGLRARIAVFRQQLAERHAGTTDRVGLVTHGDFYHHLLASILSIPPTDESAGWFYLNNLGISRLDFRAQGLRLMYLNRVDYLPASLVT